MEMEISSWAQFPSLQLFLWAVCLCWSGGGCNPASTALGHWLSLGARIFEMPMDLLLWYLWADLLLYCIVMLWVAKVLKEIALGFLTTSVMFLGRSFEPILRLLPQGISPVSQHWATWALYNLVSVYRKFSFWNHIPCTVEVEGVNLGLSAEKSCKINYVGRENFWMIQQCPAAKPNKAN